MSTPDLDETRLSESLHQLAGRANPSPDALAAVRNRHARHRRNRARVLAAGGGALAVAAALAAVSLARMGGDTEVSSTGRSPVGAEGDAATASGGFNPALVSVDWLKPEHIGTYEAPASERPERWVQSSYRGDGGRNAQLTAEHNASRSVEEKAAEREGAREEVDGPRGTRAILVSDRGRYWAYWNEGEWQFELDSGGIPSRDEALQILRSVTIDGTRFEELKLALRDRVYVTRFDDPPVAHVVVGATFEGVAWRITELASPEGQRCLGLEPDRAHRWFCIPSGYGAFTGEDPTIAPGHKVQIGDYWMYAALVDDSTAMVRVHTESTEGQLHTVELAPAPLRDGTMGVAVGMLPTTVERITTEFVDETGAVTYTATQSMAGG